MKRLPLAALVSAVLALAPSGARADGVQPIVPTAGVLYGSAQKTITSSQDVRVDTTTHVMTVIKGVRTSSVTFNDGTVMSSTNGITASSLPWGSITGTLSNQSDLQTKFNTVGTSTAALQTSINTLGTSTTSLATSVAALTVSTTSLAVSISALNTSTATITTRLNSVGVSTAALSTSTTSLQSQINSHFPVSLSSGVVGILPAANMVSTVAYTSVAQTFTAQNNWTTVLPSTFTGRVVVGSMTVSDLTASLFVVSDANKKLASLDLYGSSPTWTGQHAFTSILPTLFSRGITASTITLTSLLGVGPLRGGPSVNVSTGPTVLTSEVSGILPVANGGTGTASPALVAGTNVSISGTWPNNTINALSGGASNLATTTGSASGFAGTVSSPTAVINFDSAAFTLALKGSGTSYVLPNVSSVTLQGNTFNAANKLVLLSAGNQYPASNGNLITNLNGAAITSDDTFMLASTNTFTGGKTFSSPSGITSTYGISGASVTTLTATFSTATVSSLLSVARVNSDIGGMGHVAYGDSALSSQRLGGYNGRINTAVGSAALANFVDGGNGINTSGGNAAFGYLALGQSTGNFNSGFGDAAGAYLFKGDNNIYIGAGSGSGSGGATTSNYGNDQIYMGQYTGPNGGAAINLSNAAAIGAFASVNQSNSLVLGCMDSTVNPGNTTCGGAYTTYTVGIGTDTPKERLHIVGNLRVDAGSITVSGAVTTSSMSASLLNATTATFSAATVTGLLTVSTMTASSGTVTQLFASTANVKNSYALNGAQFVWDGGSIFSSAITCIGQLACNPSGITASALSDTAVGRQALNAVTSGGANTAVGNQALAGITTGTNSVGIGKSAGNSFQTGSFNTAVGADSGVAGNVAGSVAVGYQAGGNLGSGSSSTTVVGALSTLTSRTGVTLGTYIGWDARPTNGSLDNAAAIGANATVSASNTMQLGNNVLVLTSSAAVTGYFQMASKTGAQIRALTPAAVGQNYYCSDCTTVPVCVSTGTALGAWSISTNRTSACN